MPSSPVPSLQVTIRAPGRAPFRAVTLEDLTAIVRIKRQLMTTKREDLKALRLKAMGVLGAQMDANAEMFHRVISAGDKVATARDAAETAQMGALSEQEADLNEMVEDLQEFGNAAPKTGGSGGMQSGTTTKPAAVTAKLATGSEALASLMAAQPNPVKQVVTAEEVGDTAEVLDGDGNAYKGTSPPVL